MMARQNQKDISLKNKKLLKGKINGNNREGNWLFASAGNRFGYLSIIAVILTVFVTISLSAWLAVGQSMAYSPLAREAKERLILVQQESPQEEAQPEKSSQEEAQPEKSSQEEAQPEKSSQEEAQPEKSSQEEAQPEKSSQEEAQPEKSSQEEAQPEKSSQEEAQPEKSSQEEAQSEEELPLSEAKKSLEEEISKKYEEWESQRTSSEISHSFSAITTIVMTVLIAMLGVGLLTLPYGKQMIITFAIIAVLIQFNVNIFLLHKSLGGYKILEKQGITIKSKLVSARTNEELKEIREQFQELVLESINIE
jgi:DNA mismatch repair ATPase MutL